MRLTRLKRNEALVLARNLSTPVSSPTKSLRVVKASEILKKQALAVNVVDIFDRKLNLYSNKKNKMMKFKDLLKRFCFNKVIGISINH